MNSSRCVVVFYHSNLVEDVIPLPSLVLAGHHTKAAHPYNSQTHQNQVIPKATGVSSEGLKGVGADRFPQEDVLDGYQYK